MQTAASHGTLQELQNPEETLFFTRKDGRTPGISHKSSIAVFGGLATANSPHIKEVEREECGSHFLNLFLVFIRVFKFRWQHLLFIKTK